MSYYKLYTSRANKKKKYLKKEAKGVKLTTLR
jgi:hypothetical protein